MIYLELFLTFLKIGVCTFGGGYAMLPMIMQEVEAHGWADNATLLDFVGLSESTPGPFAVNIATFIGENSGGFLGALCATLGVVLPSFIIILIVAAFFARFSKSFFVKGIMCGLRPAVVGLIASAALTAALAVFIAGREWSAVFADRNTYVSLGIFAVSAFLIFKPKLHPAAVIGISAVIGVAYGAAFGI
ncbi:MAG: chromate transporter [Clostridia bacterium]|nr:chromate transporter [Clostridia bacterium]MBR5745995.1 chromate transporter [Clostridia bacterium]